MAMLGTLARCVVPLTLALWLLPQDPAQERLAEIRGQFNRETEPTRKAKAMTKLGDAEFAEAQRAVDAGNYDLAVHDIEQYRDDARSTEAALKATGVDPERKPGGFKQLQMHLRKCLRRLDETILAIPEEQRLRFEALRRDLLGLDKELIDLLFPRQPGKTPSPDKPKG